MDSKLIIKWLKDNERSVSWLARQVDRSSACVGKWLKNQSDIPTSVALKISEITGLEVRQICPPVAS